jgi:DNA-binding transcriptional MerR regulator
MATLRAWERRYTFPESERTSGGHRLYSENDLLQLRWVKARIDEGMATAQAIHALHRQMESGHEIRAGLPIAPPGQERQDGSPHLAVYCEALYAALIGRDLARADRALGDALAVSSPEDIILQVIGPAIARIGEAWENGEISVAAEHLTTNYLRQRLLMWMLSGPPPRQARPIVLACAPNEWHEGSLLILGALLRRRGWPVAYLGQAVPLPDLAGFVRDIQPQLVVLVSMTEQTAAELVEWPQWLPEASSSGRPMVTFGGRVFTTHPEWRVRVAGLYLGDTLEEGLAQIEKLLPG